MTFQLLDLIEISTVKIRIENEIKFYDLRILIFIVHNQT